MPTENPSRAMSEVVDLEVPDLQLIGMYLTEGTIVAIDAGVAITSSSSAREHG